VTPVPESAVIQEALALIATIGSVIGGIAVTGWYCERKWARECREKKEAWEREEQQAKLEAERKAQVEAKYERSLPTKDATGPLTWPERFWKIAPLIDAEQKLAVVA
jgi:hypothetical protein